MGEKATGHDSIPASPAVGTTVTSGGANAYSAGYTQLIASTGSAIFIKRATLRSTSGSSTLSYVALLIATGAGGSEADISKGESALVGTTSNWSAVINFDPPIPIANATRIAAKTADSQGTISWAVYLDTVPQANVVDDGVAGTITGTPDVNVKTWIGGTIPAVNIAGVPLVDAKYVNGLGIPIDSGTAQAIDATHITLRAGAPAVSLVGCLVLVDSATTGQGQVGFITAYNTGTKQATINMWSQGVTPTGTITYVVFYPLG